MLELSELNGSPDTRGLELFDGAAFGVEDFPINKSVSGKAKVDDQAKSLLIADRSRDVAKASALAQSHGSQFTTLAHCIFRVIGAKRLLFLGIHSCVCTIDPDNIGKGSIST